MKDSLHLKIDSRKCRSQRDNIRRRIAIIRGAILAHKTIDIDITYDMLREVSSPSNGMEEYLDALVELDMNEEINRYDISEFIKYWFREEGQDSDPCYLDDSIDGFCFVLNGGGKS